MSHLSNKNLNLKYEHFLVSLAIRLNMFNMNNAKYLRTFIRIDR